MRAFLAVLRLELGRWKNLLVVAALGGFMPLLAYVAPGIPDHLRGEICDGAAVIGAVCLALVTVISAGFGRLGDPAQRAFFLQRGVPTTAAWAGQHAAPWLATLGTLFWAMAPATVFGRGLAAPVLGELMSWAADVTVVDFLHVLTPQYYGEGPTVMPDLGRLRWEAWQPGLQLTILALLLLGLLLLASFVGTVLRDRSWRLIPDMFALPLVALAYAWAGAGLLAHMAWAEWVLGLVIMSSFALLGGLVGSFLAVARGRGDAPRSHLAWSLGLWTTLFLGVGIAGWRAHWALDLGLADLQLIEDARPANAGPWMFVRGEAKGRLALDASLLVNLETERQVVLAGTPYSETFSPNGAHAAWVVAAVGEDTASMYTLDLLDPEAQPVMVATPFRAERPLGSWRMGIRALSPDGTKALLTEAGRHKVIALPEGTPLVMDPPRRHRVSLAHAAFLEPGQVRLYQHVSVSEDDRWNPRIVEIGDLSWADGSYTVQGRQELGQELLGLYLRMNPSHQRALQLAKEPYRAALLDARTAETLQEIELPGLVPREHLFIADGGFVVFAGQKPTGEGRGLWEPAANIFRFDAQGQQRGEPISYAPGTYRAVGGQPSDDTLVACGRAPREGRPTWSWGEGYDCKLLDLSSGAVTPLGESKRPLGFLAILRSSDGTPPAVGSPATRLFLDADGQLLWLDLETRTLVPASVPLGS